MPFIFIFFFLKNLRIDYDLKKVAVYIILKMTKNHFKVENIIRINYHK